NQIHGDVFEFLRNGSLNARNFFAPTQDTLKRNQFGGSIGGPIKKDKLFYFGTYQGTRVRSAAQGMIAQVPTAAERAGDFSDLPEGEHPGGRCQRKQGARAEHRDQLYIYALSRPAAEHLVWPGPADGRFAFRCALRIPGCRDQDCRSYSAGDVRLGGQLLLL